MSNSPSRCHFYVENLLGLSVGAPVPHGFYDPPIGVWVPAANGVVLKILSPSAARQVPTLMATGSWTELRL